MSLISSWVAAVLLLSPGFQLNQGPPAQQAPLQETACEALAKGVATMKSPGITQPVITRKVEAKYSVGAYKAKVSGAVILCAIVDTKGRIDRLAVKSSADPLLEEPALEALKRWRFRPAQLNGVPVSVAVELEFVFTLR